MFDIGWSELMVIGVVSLIVVGPKDLPGMFHALGRFTAKARSMAREFSRAMEDAAKESGVNEVAKDLKGIASPKSMGLDKVQQAVGKFEAWDPMKKSAPTVKGPATQALSAERQAAKEKIQKAAADKALARQAAAQSKAEAAADAGLEPAPAPTPSAAAGAVPDPAAPKKSPRRTAGPKAAEAVASDSPAPKPARKPRAKKTET